MAATLVIWACNIPAAKCDLHGDLLPIPEDINLDNITGAPLIQSFKQLPLLLDLLAINANNDVTQDEPAICVPVPGTSNCDTATVWHNAADCKCGASGSDQSAPCLSDPAGHGAQAMSECPAPA